MPRNALSRDSPGFQLSSVHHEIKRDPMFHFMSEFCHAREVASSDSPFPVLLPAFIIARQQALSSF
jgi:hypothetical protein